MTHLGAGHNSSLRRSGFSAPEIDCLSRLQPQILIDFPDAESKSERLLLTAIDYSQERIIVYVAAKPPRSLLKSHAEKFGKKVVYIPIADLSPVTLRQVRVFHVLDGYPVRKWAKEYVR